MTMRGYFDVFPNRTTTELRTAEFSNDDPHDSLSGGTFVFTEFFCTDQHCDCQRVLIKVFRAKSVNDAHPEEVATISYSWNPNSDETWSVLNSDMPNPFLDPFHRQAPYASELLDFWMAMIQRDSAYASRIERHYREIRAEVKTSTAKSQAAALDEVAKFQKVRGVVQQPSANEWLERNS